MSWVPSARIFSKARVSWVSSKEATSCRTALWSHSSTQRWVERDSTPQSRVLRVVERFLADDRSPPLTQYLDLQLRAGNRKVRAHVSQGDALLEAVTVAAGRHEPRLCYAVVNDRDGGGICIGGIDQQWYETLTRARHGFASQCCLADETARLVEFHEAVERGHERRVLGGQVAFPRAVAFFEPQAVHCVQAVVRDAEAVRPPPR